MTKIKLSVKIVAALMLMGLGLSAAAEEKLATFAGGCFWCMEPPYDKLDGVISTISGYAGGDVKDPSYEQVSSGRTGHAEVVQVRYDDAKVSYETLLEVFWANIDPLDAGGQFCDRGSQYRSAIFYHNDHQEQLAHASLAAVVGKFDEAVVTPVHPLEAFYPAEKYHQNYYKKNPVRYKLYRSGCGRDGVLEDRWGDRAGKRLDLNLSVE